MAFESEEGLLLAHVALPLLFVVGVVLGPLVVLCRLCYQVAAFIRYNQMKRLAAPLTGLKRFYVFDQLNERQERDRKYFAATFCLAVLCGASIWGVVTVIGAGLEQRAAISEEIAVLAAELNRPEKSVWSEMFSADLGYTQERLPQVQTEEMWAFFGLLFRFYVVFMTGGLGFAIFVQAGREIDVGDPLSNARKAIAEDDESFNRRFSKTADDDW